MKSLLFLPALLSFRFCRAAAGSSHDETMTYLILIGALAFIYLLLKMPDFISGIKRFIQKRKMLSLIKKQHLPENETPLDPLISIY